MSFSRSISLPQQTRPPRNHIRCSIANAWETDENSAPLRGGGKYVEISRRRNRTYDVLMGLLLLLSLETPPNKKIMSKEILMFFLARLLFFQGGAVTSGSAFPSIESQFRPWEFVVYHRAPN